MREISSIKNGLGWKQWWRTGEIEELAQCVFAIGT